MIAVDSPEPIEWMARKAPARGWEAVVEVATIAEAEDPLTFDHFIMDVKDHWDLNKPDPRDPPPAYEQQAPFPPPPPEEVWPPLSPDPAPDYMEGPSDDDLPY